MYRILHFADLHLEKADILLEHSKSGLWGRLIRFGTGSYWNHALLVYDVGNGFGSLDDTLVIDPRMGRIEVINLLDYLKGARKYNFAVKRLAGEWFKHKDESGILIYQKAVTDRALREIAGENKSAFLTGQIRKMVRRLTVIYRFFTRERQFLRLGRGKTRIVRTLNANAYFCSGFVQWSYYKGISSLIAESKLDNSRLTDVIFNRRLIGEVSDYDLLSIYPQNWPVAINYPGSI